MRLTVLIASAMFVLVAAIGHPASAQSENRSYKIELRYQKFLYIKRRKSEGTRRSGGIPVFVSIRGKKHFVGDELAANPAGFIGTVHTSSGRSCYKDGSFKICHKVRFGGGGQYGISIEVYSRTVDSLVDSYTMNFKETGSGCKVSNASYNPAKDDIFVHEVSNFRVTCKKFAG